MWGVKWHSQPRASASDLVGDTYFNVRFNERLCWSSNDILLNYPTYHPQLPTTLVTILPSRDGGYCYYVRSGAEVGLRFGICKCV